MLPSYSSYARAAAYSATAAAKYAPGFTFDAAFPVSDAADAVFDPVAAGLERRMLLVEVGPLSPALICLVMTAEDVITLLAEFVVVVYSVQVRQTPEPVPDHAEHHPPGPFGPADRVNMEHRVRSIYMPQ
jgi:hypothetical protein